MRAITAAGILIYLALVVLKLMTPVAWVNDHPTEAPVAGAYVAMIGADGRLQQTTTGRTGRFKLKVTPADQATGRLLICARGRPPMLVAPSVAVFSTYGLDPGGLRFKNVREQGWTGPVPAACGNQDPSAVVTCRMHRQLCARRAADPLKPRT